MNNEIAEKFVLTNPLVYFYVPPKCSQSVRYLVDYQHMDFHHLTKKNSNSTSIIGINSFKQLHTTNSMQEYMFFLKL